MPHPCPTHTVPTCSPAGGGGQICMEQQAGARAAPAGEASTAGTSGGIGVIQGPGGAASGRAHGGVRIGSAAVRAAGSVKPPRPAAGGCCSGSGQEADGTPSGAGVGGASVACVAIAAAGAGANGAAGTGATGTDACARGTGAITGGGMAPADPAPAPVSAPHCGCDASDASSTAEVAAARSAAGPSTGGAGARWGRRRSSACAAWRRTATQKR
jgi:hypothetical protein